MISICIMKYFMDITVQYLSSVLWLVDDGYYDTRVELVESYTFEVQG